MPRISPAKRRLLELLKRTGESTAGSLAETLRLTDVAVRQHLAALEEAGLVVSRTRAPTGRGRPSLAWSLTERAHGEFPERHAELTLGLVEAIREAFGEKGLRRVIDVRAREQVAEYAARIPARGSLKRRVEALAAERSREGYMAEVVQEHPGCYLLIEHHCPICEAAKACTGLCAAELSVFQKTLGKAVRVERIAHLLAGETRCVYRIQGG